MTKMPAFLTWAVPTSAKVLRSLAATAFLTSHVVARWSATAPLVMTTAFVAAAFMGAPM